jgi:hypothetical protein
MEQNHLHKDANRYKYLGLYHYAIQRESKKPSKFFARLSLLATALGWKLSLDDLLSRLQKGLQTQIVQNGRKSRNIKELLAHAQEIWAIFKNNK